MDTPEPDYPSPNEQRIIDLEDGMHYALSLLDIADCPQCVDKSEAYYDNNGEVCQCQWCYEVAEFKLKWEK